MICYLHLLLRSDTGTYEGAENSINSAGYRYSDEDGASNVTSCCNELLNSIKL
jgi:hypothetical protein